MAYGLVNAVAAQCDNYRILTKTRDDHSTRLSTSVPADFFKN